MRPVNTPKSIVEAFIHKHAPEKFRIPQPLKQALAHTIKLILRVIYLPYQWFFLMPFLMLTTLVCGSFAFMAAFFSEGKARYFGVLWSRLNSFFTPMSVTVIGRDNMALKQSYVIVANHQSYFDIHVLYGWLGVDFRWVMKKSLEKVPVLGPACKALGHIFVDRSDTTQALAAINAVKSKLHGGTSVFFFPEGYRSIDGNVGTFKKGAFKLALDLGLPILPVTLVGTRGIMSKGSVQIMPGSVKLIIHAPIKTEDIPEDGVNQLIAKTRSVVISGISPQ